MLRRIVALAALTATLAASARAQAPAAEATTPPPGSVSGHVTVDGKPAAGLVVRLMAGEFDSEQKRPRTTATDSDGRYEFTDVPPGRYSVSPYAPGLSGPNAGWELPNTQVSVVSGETIKDIDVALERGGVVTGRITDGEGRPLVEQQVALLKADASGKKQPVQVPNMHFMRTDDRGIYRIYGVPPGRYFVAVGRGGQGGMMFGASANVAQTFYPGTTNEAEAKEVAIASGGEAAGVNISVAARETTYSASGRVVVPEGGSLAGYWVLYGPLVDKRMNGMSQGSAISATGEFRIDGLGPGTYGVTVMALPGTASGGYGDLASFQISDSDVTGLEIQIHRGASLSGVLVMDDPSEPGTAEKISKFGLYAIVERPEGEEGATSPIPASTEVGQDGSFTLSGVKAGTARLWLNDFRGPKGYSIVRIERDGVPIANGFPVAEDETITGIRIVIGHGAGVIRGQVTLKNGALPEGYKVYARVTSLGGGAFQRWSPVDARGQFTADGLVAGDYEISLRAASESASKLYAFKPDVSQTVSVTGSGPASVAITVDMGAVELVEVPQ